ncbi:MAG: 5'-nucleotidase C-terminal domain-containing protein [Vicinamibacterales bacterium]
MRGSHPPDDLSSCDDDAEIFALARALPAGLVDAIAAGHTHDGVAHRVAGTPIVQAYSWGRAFGRVDLHVRRSDGVVARSTIHGPEPVCAWRDAASGACVNAGAAGAVAARYADRPVVPLPAVDAATQATRERVARLRATVVSPRRAAAVPRGGAGGESPLGNLMADAMRAMTPGADAALSYGAGPGGLRADLPPGAPTLGALYDVFPFDNRIEVLALTPAELARLIADHGRRPRWGARALGVSGLTVQLGCTGAGSVAVADTAGRPVAEARSLTVALSDFLAARARRLGVGRVARPPAPDAPLVRDALLTWFRREVQATGLLGRWIAAGETPAACGP